ncbi:helix-turn-helix domain-containing protein [Streptomyces sp. NBC_00727]|uniref:XRE family transcriptional regulator n=1 Tax=Streptomyces sp. NBC_00727 TaxID=2903675 RepID=UPI003867C9DF
MSDENSTSLADRLNHLFATVGPDSGQEYSNEYVAAAIRKAGVPISQSYIWQLRKRRKENPTLRHLQALADFFGVPAAYFFDNGVARRVEDQLTALRAEQDRLAQNGGRDVRLMAMRAGELSPARRKQVMELIDVVYKLEQAERRSASGD